jgi:hypothetical protein
VLIIEHFAMRVVIRPSSSSIGGWAVDIYNKVTKTLERVHFTGQGGGR